MGSPIEGTHFLEEADSTEEANSMHMADSIHEADFEADFMEEARMEGMEDVSL